MGFLFWLIIGAVIFYLLSRPGGRWPDLGRGAGTDAGRGPLGESGESGETPRQILDRRLAKGEITVEEYRRILQELGSQ